MSNLDTRQLLDGLPKDLTLSFFAIFARLEYAMKRCGCIRAAAAARPAEASWRELVKILPDDFFKSVREAGIAKTLIDTPPRNLVVTSDGVDFDPAREPLKDAGELLQYAWRVRNNLFHGNKRYPGNRERDIALMQDVLALIEALLNAHSELESAFHDPVYSY